MWLVVAQRYRDAFDIIPMLSLHENRGENLSTRTAPLNNHNCRKFYSRRLGGGQRPTLFDLEGFSSKITHRKSIVTVRASPLNLSLEEVTNFLDH
jgi:hypothetical protein